MLLSKLKRGEYFRFKGRKKIYQKDGGGLKRGICYTAVDDINASYMTKTDKQIETGFEF